MRSHTLRKVLFYLGFALIAFQACRKDDTGSLTPPPIADQSFVEEFDTTSSAYERCWRYINVSSPKGTGFWNQGLFNNPTVTGFPTPIPFNAYSSKGSYVGFIGADYTSTSAAAGTISTWVVSPTRMLQNGDKIIFYTRTVVVSIGGGDSTDYGNRMQVRVSTNGESTNVGSGDDPGDFTHNVLDINPDYPNHNAFTSAATYDPVAYPIRWTKFEATLGGLNGPVNGRFAFRYYLNDAGTAGYGTAVAIDSVAFVGKK